MARPQRQILTRDQANDEGGAVLLTAVPGTEDALLAAGRKKPLARLEGSIDSVYFLMFDGWETELESNRWHYARRWAQHLPVTLLQPRQRYGRLRDAFASGAIENCEILPIARPAYAGPYHLRGFVQAAQVMEHMARRGHRKALLWCYNAGLATLYAALPAAVRVYHASENYFDMETMPELFYRELEATIRISDLVIPVSSGVGEGIRARIPEARLEVVTNGCDLEHYRISGPTSPEVAAARGEFERVAVFAGNVNGRIDFDLVERAAAANPRTLLVFVGPVSLDDAGVEAWRRIQGLTNVLHLDRMRPTDLAAVYRSADLGFIPYRSDPWLVRNSYPLKTLEMAATGLPVVTSRMDPIAGLASALAVAEDDERFLDSFSSLSRSTIRDEERLELLELAAANDYDRKFEQVVTHVAQALPAGSPVRTCLDQLLADLGHDSWQASCRRIFRLSRPTLTWRSVLLAYDRYADVVPPEARSRVIPSALRDWARGRVNG